MTPLVSHLRFPVSSSRGRRYPELAHPYRNEFQRDRDRIVHARAFRRLEDKTQVFTDAFSDHFRNRLTHTIEVAQLARTAAAALGLDEDLTEALALAHDIGHPPFAHSGEEELNRQMRRFGERFDHNLHSLRIVESFEQPYACFPGLNLTFEVREGIAKHSRDIEPGESAELDEYLPGLRPTLEAQLIDLADEIAYNTADLDDALSAGFYVVEDIAAAIPDYAALAEFVDTQIPGAAPQVRFRETLRRLIDTLVTGLIEGVAAAAAAAGVRDHHDVRLHPTRLSSYTPAAARLSRALKLFLHSRVYSSDVLMAERDKCSRMMAELFDFFLRDPARLPAVYAERAVAQPPHNVVCDYIAGMTDGFFRRTYRQMIG
jgi:dGTPase